MAKKRPAHDEDAWTNAKKACRLSVRQVEMARALGLNPRKLPGLRPSPQQRWKRPVGEFIEECFRKRFCDARDRDPHGSQPRSPQSSIVDQDVEAPERERIAAGQLSELVCYLMNLADDLQQHLRNGNAVGDVLSHVSEELRGIAKALETGTSISAIPEIPPPPRRRAHSARVEALRDRAVDDDEIPF
jgi:hypothetical protein